MYWLNSPRWHQAREHVHCGVHGKVGVENDGRMYAWESNTLVKYYRGSTIIDDDKIFLEEAKIYRSGTFRFAG